MACRATIMVFGHSPGLGGAERSLLESLRLLRSEHEIILVAPGRGPFLEAARELRLEEICVIPQHSYYEKSGYSKVKRSAKALINIAAVGRALRLAAKRRPSVIYSNSVAGWTGALVARLQKIPHVWHLREMVHEQNLGRPVFGNRLQKGLLQGPGMLVCNSAYVRDWYSKSFGVTPTVAYQPVQVPRLTPERLDSARKTFAVFGRLEHQKRQQVTVEAVAQLPASLRQRVRLKLYGHASGNYASQLQDLVVRSGLTAQVEMPGFTSAPTQEILNCDLVLAPAVDEAFGRVTAEAMLLGVPVVGAASAGTLELIGAQNERGFLFPADDAAALSKLLGAFIQDPEPFLQRAEQAQTWARAAFDEGEYLRKVLEAFEYCRRSQGLA